LLLFATLSSTAVAQPRPQPTFTELFSYDPAAPSQLLGKWRISSQLDNHLQALRVGVVEDPIGKTVGRVTVQEGDGLDGASEAMLQARRYVCDSKGSRAAAIEAEPGGIVPSERAEIQVRSDRPTGAGELVKFGQPVWYRFSFKIPSDWPRDVPAAGRQLCRTVIHQINRIPSMAGSRATPAPFSRSRCAGKRELEAGWLLPSWWPAAMFPGSRAVLRPNPSRAGARPFRRHQQADLNLHEGSSSWQYAMPVPTESEKPRTEVTVSALIGALTVVNFSFARRSRGAAHTGSTWGLFR
jgi:hypothetical protein